MKKTPFPATGKGLFFKKNINKFVWLLKRNQEQIINWGLSLKEWRGSLANGNYTYEIIMSFVLFTHFPYSGDSK